MKVLTPYEEGFIAGVLNYPILSNPWLRWGYGWVRWRTGYIDGRFN